MTKTYRGVKYSIASPSYWSLEGYPVHITFLGDKWSLCCPGEDGEPKFRYFDRREQAQAMIEKALGVS